MRIRQHVDPRGAYFAQFRGERIAADGPPLEVEIGCAEAQFLFERAAAEPARRYVGLEIREDLVELVNRRARDEHVPVTAVFCHAQLHLAEVFAAGSVERVYVNFPDPWFKRRHHDRRMVDGQLAVGIAHILREGGELYIQTDVWDIAVAALSAFESNAQFANRAGEWTFWRAGNPYLVRSWREQNAEEIGLPIWRLWYRREREA